MVTKPGCLLGGADGVASLDGSISADFTTSKTIRFETEWQFGDGRSSVYDTESWSFDEIEPVTNLEGTLTVRPYLFVSARARLFGTVGPRLDVETDNIRNNTCPP